MSKVGNKLRNLIKRKRAVPVTALFLAKDLPWCKGETLLDPDEEFKCVIAFVRPPTSRKKERFTLPEPMLYDDAVSMINELQSIKNKPHG